MKILGDSNITSADITATNTVSSLQAERLKTFQLSDCMRTLSNSTVIDFTFNGTVPNIDCISLCGTNLTSNATIVLSYSNTDISSPDASISLPLYSILNQVFFLSTELNRKYWRLTIADTSLTTLQLGYLYTGVALDIPYVEFGRIPSMDIFSNPAVSMTGQGYGSKLYNSNSIDFNMYMDIDLLKKYLAIKQVKQNIDPVLIVEYTESYDLDIYRPKYGVLINSENPYQKSHNHLQYSISDRLEERF
ncbi:MAG: hypothetical protein GY804_13935 [Alphaproteobacteria bacterium]|nr:hypothetical protein [Alphaproteobacteria bacterium]